MSVKKERYLFYNDNYELLCFRYHNKRMNLFFPSLYDFESIDDYANFNKIIIDYLGKDCDCLFLDSTREDRNIFKCVNNKLYKDKLTIIRDYFSCYKNFSYEDIGFINRICYDNRLKPEFVNINKLIDTENNYKVYIGNDSYKVLKKLKSKLDYERY